jgi:hypothetical protein
MECVERGSVEFEAGHVVNAFVEAAVECPAFK